MNRRALLSSLFAAPVAALLPARPQLPEPMPTETLTASVTFVRERGEYRLLAQDFPTSTWRTVTAWHDAAADKVGVRIEECTP